MRDLPYLKASIRDLKVKLARFGIESMHEMQKITIGITEKSENFGRDDGIEEALWRSFKDLILKDNEVTLNKTTK